MDKWEALRQWIENYARNHGEEIRKYKDDPPMRYCVSISCEDLLSIMDDFDKNFE